IPDLNSRFLGSLALIMASTGDFPDVSLRKLEEGAGAAESKPKEDTDKGTEPSVQPNGGDKYSLEPDEESPYAQHCQGNAKIWSKYLRETDAEDKEVTAIGNSSLDSMLTFAGLFASVLAAFLLESRKDLKEDPQERLLTELLDAFRGVSPTSPRETFHPTASAVAVNSLWFSSLTLTLLSALSGVLAKGWLAQYNPASKRERSEDAYKRQHRSNRAEAWGLDTVISLIPFLIQISLFLFFAGLLIQVQSDDLRIRLVLLLLVLIAATLYLFSTFSPLFITEFPFSTPLSHYLAALARYRKHDWDWNVLFEAFQRTKERLLRAYNPTDLQLEILTWGVANAVDEETTDEAIKALSGVKQSIELREKLYNQTMHRYIFERLQQNIRPTRGSSLIINNSSQLEAILLALLKIEEPMTLSDQQVFNTSIPQEIVMSLSDWEGFQPCLQPLAFTVRTHMLLNRGWDDHSNLWLQRTDALDRMAQNPSTIYIRRKLLFATLRGLLNGEEYTRGQCGIVLSRLLMTRESILISRFVLTDDNIVSSFDEVVRILESPPEGSLTWRGSQYDEGLSESIIRLISCDDRSSRDIGIRMALQLASHVSDFWANWDDAVSMQSTKIHELIEVAGGMLLSVEKRVPQLLDMLKDSNWEIRETAVTAIGQLGQQVTETLRNTVKDAIPQLVDLLKDSDWSVRYRAREVIEQLIVKDAFPQLVDMLKHPDSNIRSVALETIGKLAQYELVRDMIKDAIPQLMDMFKDSGWAVRREAARVTERLVRHVKDAIPQLVDMFKDSDYDVREASVVAIGVLARYGGAVESLRYMVKDMIPQLVDMFNDVEYEVRRAAVNSIGQLAGHDRATELLQGMVKDAIPQLVNMLKDLQSAVREAAVTVIGQLVQYGVDSLRDRLKDVIPQLIDMFKDSEASVRKAAVTTYGQLARQASLQDVVKVMVPRLMDLLKDPDRDVRLSTITTAQGIDPYDTTWDPLPVSVSDSPRSRYLPISRSLMIRGASEIPENRAIEKWYNSCQLLVALTYFWRRCEHSFESTINAIAKEFAPTGIDELSVDTGRITTIIVMKWIKESGNSLESKENEEVGQESDSVARLFEGSPVEESCQPMVKGIVPHIMGMFKYWITDVNLAAVTAIGQLAQHGRTAESLRDVVKDTILQLMDKLKDSEGASRIAVIEATRRLAQYGGDAIPQLIATFRDSELYARRAAVTAIGELAQQVKGVIPQLVDMSKDPQWFIREAAVMTIGQLAQQAAESLQDAIKETIPQLADMLKDISSGVRKAFIEAIEQLAQQVKGTIPQIVDAFKDLEESVRRAAVIAIGQLAQYDLLQDTIKDAIPQLVDMFKDSYQFVHGGLVSVLGQLAQQVKDSIPKFGDMFKDPGPDIRQIAVVAIRELVQYGKRLVSDCSGVTDAES
ncbi:5218_t:CDS:10, partial [Acaulospora colombiana]